MDKKAEERFDEIYLTKGGIKTLQYMVREEFYTTEFIAQHFGVSRVKMQDWIDKIFGENYNPTKQRKEKIIETMLTFAETHTLQEFRDAYYYVNKHYYDIALAECYVRGIYKYEHQ